MQNENINEESLKRYKVRGVNLDQCPDTSLCRIEISVGQHYHEGGRLRAIFNWATRFNQNVLILGDSLQRYNMSYNEAISMDAAMEKSVRLGDEWLARNQNAMQILPELRVTRWNDWLQHPKYAENRVKTGVLYETNDHFRKAVDAKMDEFLLRRGAGDLENFRKSSLQYLLEEYAALAVVYEELKGFTAYPNPFIDTVSIAKVNQGANENIPKGFENGHFVRLKFTSLSAG